MRKNKTRTMSDVLRRELDELRQRNALMEAEAEHKLNAVFNVIQEGRHPPSDAGYGRV